MSDTFLDRARFQIHRKNNSLCGAVPMLLVMGVRFLSAANNVDRAHGCPNRGNVNLESPACAGLHCKN